MTKAIWLAAAACALSAPATAQTAAVARQDMLVFDLAFFADARPDTALDMISRLPGFALNTGASGTRGLAGTAGNVLIDGRHPSTKSDNLEQILRRISAASVARIELIRGGAPGIDMQGRSVVAKYHPGPHRDDRAGHRGQRLCLSRRLHWSRDFGPIGSARGR